MPVVRLLFTFIFLIIGLVIKAQSIYPNVNSKRLSLEISAGYSSEDLSWSIAGNSKGQNPNVYSELIWKNQLGPILGLSGKYSLLKSFFVEADYSLKKVTGGQVTDTDYGSDNRTNPEFYVQLNTNRGSTTQGTLTLHYLLKVTNKFNLLLGTGYVVKQQSLYLDDSDANAQEHLNSNYKTNWKGWLLSFKPVYYLGNRVTLSGRIRYHQVKYAAKANWNLIPEFEHPLSFQHSAEGYGLDVTGAICLKISQQLFIHLTAIHGKLTTGKGTDILYLLNGERPVTQLNGVNNTTNTIFAGLGLSL